MLPLGLRIFPDSNFPWGGACPEALPQLLNLPPQVGSCLFLVNKYRKVIIFITDLLEKPKRKKNREFPDDGVPRGSDFCVDGRVVYETQSARFGANHWFHPRLLTACQGVLLLVPIVAVAIHLFLFFLFPPENQTTDLNKEHLSCLLQSQSERGHPEKKKQKKERKWGKR